MIPKTLKAMIPPLKNFKARQGYENDEEASVGLHNYSGPAGVHHNYLVLIKKKPAARPDGLPYYHVKVTLPYGELRPIEKFEHDLVSARAGYAWQGAMTGGYLFEIWTRDPKGGKAIEKAIRTMVASVDKMDL